MLVRNRSLLCGVLLAASIFASANASAYSPAPQQRVVRYTKADFASEARVAALYKRLKRASHKVCEVFQRADLEAQHMYRQCFDKALADAVYGVNEQTLIALHERPSARPARAARSTARSAAEQRG